MLPYFYLRDILTWLKTNEQYSKFEKFQMTFWLASIIFTTIAVIALFIAAFVYSNSDLWLLAGGYVLNYPAIWFLRPRVVKHHKIVWRDDNGSK